MKLGTREDLANLIGVGLHPAILEAIECLPVGAGNDVTERWLRPIV